MVEVKKDILIQVNIVSFEKSAKKYLFFEPPQFLIREAGLRLPLMRNIFLKYEAEKNKIYLIWHTSFQTDIILILLSLETSSYQDPELF